MLDGNVLVLNKYFQLIRTTTVKRAMVLLFSGKVKAVTDDYRTYDWEEWADIPVQPETDDYIRTPRKNILVPSVVQLLDYEQIPRKVLRLNRVNIFARDKNRCQYCGRKFPTGKLSIDHVIPQSRGGKTTWDNVVCACLKCNVRKGNRTPVEADMPLMKLPARPQWNPIHGLIIGRNFPAKWKNFLDEAYWNVPLKED